MDKLSVRIRAELDNIEAVLKELPSSSSLPYLSILELAGTATLLHNFYNGIENIIKQIFIFEKIELPTGNAWHKQLLTKAKDQNIITENFMVIIFQYLGFRHFLNHGYAFELYYEKMEPLVENTQKTYKEFLENISKYLQ